MAGVSRGSWATLPAYFGELGGKCSILLLLLFDKPNCLGYLRREQFFHLKCTLKVIAMKALCLGFCTIFFVLMNITESECPINVT